MSRLYSSFRQTNVRNIHILRTSPLSEISGALGDLGTLLPILIALSADHQISLSSTLVFTGVSNILTGAIFGIPLPVQPMKVIAAIALSNKFPLTVVAVSGIYVALAVLFLACTGLLRWSSRLIPIPIIKGIQVGTGLSLVITAGAQQLRYLSWWQSDLGRNGFVALLAALFLVRTAQYRKQFPSALVIFLAGLLFLALRLSGDSPTLPTPHIWHPRILDSFWNSPHWDDSLYAAIAQLPLTVLNSIIAVTHLSSDLLPDVAPPSVNALAASVVLMNLIGCSFGAMPVCHGSGGLAAQYRFGARSGSSIILLGFLKLILGLFLGRPALVILERFPKTILGVMVIFAGLELVKVGESLNSTARDLYASEPDEGIAPLSDSTVREPRVVECEEGERRWVVMLGTVAGLLASRNAAVGCCVGGVMELSYRFPPETNSERRWPNWRAGWRQLGGPPDLIGELREGEDSTTDEMATGITREPYHD